MPFKLPRIVSPATALTGIGAVRMPNSPFSFVKVDRFTAGMQGRAAVCTRRRLHEGCAAYTICI